MPKIYIIGGANIDIYANSESLVLKDSNPSDITYSHGGVCRNICENLANLNIGSSFISAFGNDAFGKDLSNELIHKGVDLSLSLFLDDKKTSTYIAFLKENDLYLGASDMSILEALDTNYLSKLKDIIQNDDYVIFDTNLKEETIDYIINNIKGYKIVDAISANKVVKLKNNFRKIDLLKLNLLEAEYLANEKLDNDEKIISFLKNNASNNTIIISKASDLFVGNSNVEHYRHYSYNANALNTTGAGDALVAGYVYGIINKYSNDEKARFALAMAILNVNSKDAVNKGSINDIKELIKDLRIEKV